MGISFNSNNFFEMFEQSNSDIQWVLIGCQALKPSLNKKQTRCLMDGFLVKHPIFHEMICSQPTETTRNNIFKTGCLGFQVELTTVQKLLLMLQKSSSDQLIW